MWTEGSTRRRPSTLVTDVAKSAAAVWLLALAAWSSVFLGPWGLLSWIAGLSTSAFLWIALRACFTLLGWPVLFVWACVRFVRDLRSQRKMRATLWLSTALAIVLAYALLVTGKTPPDKEFFGRGLLTRLEIRTDVDALRTWVVSLEPGDCMTEGHSSEPRPWRYLSREEQPQILKPRRDYVRLELDARGKPSVRLEWWQSKAGVFGLVIGQRAMKTPPSEPGTYGEKRTELRPGIYFWYTDA